MEYVNISLIFVFFGLFLWMCSSNNSEENSHKLEDGKRNLGVNQSNEKEYIHKRFKKI